MMLGLISFLPVMIKSLARVSHGTVFCLQDINCHRFLIMLIKNENENTVLPRPHFHLDWAWVDKILMEKWLPGMQ